MTQSYASTSTSKFTRALLRALDTPYADSLLKALTHENYDVVTSAKVDPAAYTDPDLFKRDYLAANLLRKFNDLPMEVDRAAVAIGKFLESEEHCRTLNHYRGRDPFTADSESGNLSRTFEATIWLAKEKISRVLGTFSWDDAFSMFGFSGGASTRLTRKSGAPFYKYQGKPETTRDCALLSVCAIWATPLWRQQMQDHYGLDPCNWVTIVDGSRTTTVPKTSLTDRTICVEPCMNMYIQRGIGGVIRQKLRRVGVDLNDQTINQRLALIGSRTGSLATIDLSSASDTISMSLVEALVPHDWFEALCRTRSSVTILPSGVKHRLEKISSMGNGFTFELESLIFWALSSAVIDLSGVKDRRCGIYGDDIIVHHEVAPRLIEVLAYCGFATNGDKTFINGPFRESCGKHYFYGADVTPFYVKERIEGPERLFWLLNSIRLWCYGTAVESDVMNVARYVRKQLPARMRRWFIPLSYGLTAGIVAPWDEAMPDYCKLRQSYRVRVLRPSRKRHRPNGFSALLQWFNGAGQTASESLLWLEKGETRYKPARAYLAWWDEVQVPHLG